MSTKAIDLDLTATAVITIDIQKDYFWGGKFPLWRSGRALRRARQVLDWARDKNLPIIHVQHFSNRPGSWFLVEGTPGTALHPGLGIRQSETVIPKHWPNSFRETDLERVLREREIKTAIWMGMITWMCVDTTVRAAYDLGFANILVGDATAAGVLPRQAGMPGLVFPWRSQSGFLAALGAVHAKIVTSRAVCNHNRT